MKASSSSQGQSPRTPSPRDTSATAEHTRSSSEPWLVAAAVASTCDDSCVNDVENFARTVAAAKSRQLVGSSAASRPDMLASVLSHYAAKWLPDVVAASSSSSSPATSASGRFLPPESPTATWLKKRLLLESLVAALPPDPPAPGGGGSGRRRHHVRLPAQAAPGGEHGGCRRGSAAGAGVRAARRLDQATLGAVMIPAFGHGYACGTLLDVPLVLRLVRGFLKDAGAGGAAPPRQAVAEAPPPQVARLVDAYLA